MNIELNTIELVILNDAVRGQHRMLGYWAAMEGWSADFKQLETKLAEALENSRIAAKAAALPTV
jgi:hypothetical protein